MQINTRIENCETNPNDEKMRVLSRNDAVATALHHGLLIAKAGRWIDSTQGEPANHQVRANAMATDFPLPSLARGEGQGEGSRLGFATGSFRLSADCGIGNRTPNPETRFQFHPTKSDRIGYIPPGWEPTLPGQAVRVYLPGCTPRRFARHKRCLRSLRVDPLLLAK